MVARLLDLPWGRRFLSKIEAGAPDECWLWKNGKDQDGYAIFWLEGKSRRATRLLWETLFGPLSEEGCVLHRCDNPPCMNPSHLFAGTQLENIEDRVRKGRTARQFGDSNGKRKTMKKKDEVA